MRDFNSMSMGKTSNDQVRELRLELQLAKEIINIKDRALEGIKEALDSCRFGESYDWPDYAENALSLKLK